MSCIPQDFVSAFGEQPKCTQDNNGSKLDVAELAGSASQVFSKAIKSSLKNFLLDMIPIQSQVRPGHRYHYVWPKAPTYHTQHTVHRYPKSLKSGQEYQFYHAPNVLQSKASQTWLPSVADPLARYVGTVPTACLIIRPATTLLRTNHQPSHTTIEENVEFLISLSRPWLELWYQLCVTLSS